MLTKHIHTESFTVSTVISFCLSNNKSGQVYVQHPPYKFLYMSCSYRNHNIRMSLLIQSEIRITVSTIGAAVNENSWKMYVFVYLFPSFFHQFDLVNSHPQANSPLSNDICESGRVGHTYASLETCEAAVGIVSNYCSCSVIHLEESTIYSLHKHTDAHNWLSMPSILPPQEHSHFWVFIMDG